MTSFIFTGIQRIKPGLFYKSNSASFTNRCFINDAMEHWKSPRKGHLVFVIFRISLVLITAVRWQSRGKYNCTLVNILYVIYHASRYINTIVRACQFLVQREFFSSLFVKLMVPWICCVCHGNHKVQSACMVLTQLSFDFYLAWKQGDCSLLVLAQLW